MDLIERIMPRIQPISIFEIADKNTIAHIPFVNNTVVTYVIDHGKITTTLTLAEMINEGLTIEDVEKYAVANLQRLVGELDAKICDTVEGGKALYFKAEDPYTSSRLLHPDFHRTFAPSLGGDFYAGAPTRDHLVGFSVKPDSQVSRLKQMMQEEGRKSGLPITSELFYITADGIAGTATDSVE